MTYQIELVDKNGNAEIIEENITSLEKAKEKTLNFVKYENNLSEHDKKMSCVLVYEIEGNFCGSVSSFKFE